MRRLDLVRNQQLCFRIIPHPTLLPTAGGRGGLPRRLPGAGVNGLLVAGAGWNVTCWSRSSGTIAKHLYAWRPATPPEFCSGSLGFCSVLGTTAAERGPSGCPLGSCHCQHRHFSLRAVYTYRMVLVGGSDITVFHTDVPARYRLLFKDKRMKCGTERHCRMQGSSICVEGLSMAPHSCRGTRRPLRFICMVKI